MSGQTHPPSLCSRGLVRGSFLQQDCLRSLKTDGWKNKRAFCTLVLSLSRKGGLGQRPAAELAQEAYPQMEQDPHTGTPMVPGPWARKPALGSLVMVLCLLSALAWLLCVQGGCDRCSPGLVEGCLHLIPYLPPTRLHTPRTHKGN